MNIDDVEIDNSELMNMVFNVLKKLIDEGISFEEFLKNYEVNEKYPKLINQFIPEKFQGEERQIVESVIRASVLIAL